MLFPKAPQAAIASTSPVTSDVSMNSSALASTVAPQPAVSFNPTLSRIQSEMPVDPIVQPVIDPPNIVEEPITAPLPIDVLDSSTAISKTRKRTRRGRVRRSIRRRLLRSTLVVLFGRKRASTLVEVIETKIGVDGESKCPLALLRQHLTIYSPFE